MIPLFSAAQIREIDSHTLLTESISSLDLMERAASAVVDRIKTDFKNKKQSFDLYCGPGNNGGDGLAIARMLKENGYAVRVFLLPSENKSPNFSANLKRLPCQSEILDKKHFQKNTEEDHILIDALFGAGLNRPLSGFAADLVDYINKQQVFKIAIDLPSGLQVDQCSLSGEFAIVKADLTLTFEYPKLNFLLPENAVYVGRWELVRIGLKAPSFALTKFYFTEEDALRIYKRRQVFSHKGTFGHGLLLAGSKGKMGAAVLASRSAMRAGLGLLTVQVPKCGVDIMQTSIPEAMCLLDEGENSLESYLDYSKFNALAIGPGMGLEQASQNILKRIIQDAQLPLIVDADGLNALAENKTWLSFLPHGTILSPHPGEFRRLVGSWENDQERLSLLIEFARKYGAFVILKGKYTSIASPDGKVFFNSTGNSGMATAGSGDSLTGILLALLSGGYEPEQAALLAVFIHGRAGDLAAAELSEEAMIASDLSDFLPKAFKSLQA